MIMWAFGPYEWYVSILRSGGEATALTKLICGAVAFLEIRVINHLKRDGCWDIEVFLNGKWLEATLNLKTREIRLVA